MKVEVYRNLHNGMLSIRDAKTKHVVGHANRVTLADATFHVSQAGRERVLREKRKNVHAVVRGTLVSFLLGGSYKGRNLPSYIPEGEVPQFAMSDVQVKYNPYKYSTFMAGDEPVHDAKAVRIGIAGIHLGELFYGGLGTPRPQRG